ncbi:MAG: hypothetical protein E6I38_03460 [Chloroflexi bacterium]|nr:MAG: hypothetical protein E6I38_03460 [Chloroflexota bacterium]
MNRALVIAAGAIIIPVVMALAVTNSDWFSGSSASAALLASDVRPGRPSVGTDASEAELGVAGGPLDCPPAGAGPEDSEQLFQRQGDKFWVTGMLSSFDGANAVVAGPSGAISAKLGANFNLAGDLSAGSAVEMAGNVAGDGSMTASEIRAVCPDADVIDCVSGEDTHFQLRIEGDTFEVTGRLDSISNELVRVQGPGLLVEISRDVGTQVEGGLKAGDPVRVEGSVRDAQQLHALTVALRCAEALTPSAAAAAAQETAEASPGQASEDCKRGSNGRGAARLKVHNGEAEAKRVAVMSRNGDDLTVESPSGEVSVRVDDKTHIEGDLESAEEIRVQGGLQNDDSILAEEIDVLCTQGDNRGQDEGKQKEKRDEGDGGDKEKENED